jgi:hypothetical protein
VRWEGGGGVVAEGYDHNDEKRGISLKSTRTNNKRVVSVTVGILSR